MSENIPNLTENMNAQIQEAQLFVSRMNASKTTPRYIRVKQLTDKKRENVENRKRKNTRYIQGDNKKMM